MLLDYFIQFTDASSKEGQDFLQRMAETGVFPGYETVDYGKVVNKTQRYACLRKLVQQKGIESGELAGLIGQERKTDYSAGDETEMIKLQAADPHQKNKQRIWDTYVSPDDKFKQ